MKLGVIGLGVIGTATKQGFEHLGHSVYAHDIKLGTSIDIVLDTNVCFICVPTNSLDDGSCDTSIVESVIDDLIQNSYEGIIAIKSTVLPGTTLRIAQKHNTESIVFVPEFLRERCAYEDFVHNQDICVIGAQNNEQFDLLKKIHGNLPEKFIKSTPTEAELVKYFNNLYNATLITFANSFGTLCESLNIDYMRVKSIATQRKHINDVYLNFDEKTKGFGGVCLPKDTKAINHLANKIAPHITFFRDILLQNDKFEITVFNNMRK